MNNSPIDSTSTDECATAVFTTCSPSLVAGMVESAPPKLPIGVLMADIM